VKERKMEKILKIKIVKRERKKEKDKKRNMKTKYIGLRLLSSKVVIYICCVFL